MGLFENVQVEADPKEEGYLLRFVVTERPRIGSIRLSGRQLIPEADLTEKLETKENDIYDPVKIKQDEKIIRDLYRKEGYARTNVSSKIEVISEKKYIIEFVIEENPQVFFDQYSYCR